MDYKAVLEKQITLLAEWNEKHIEAGAEPEQIRANISVMCGAIEVIRSFDCITETYFPHNNR